MEVRNMTDIESLDPSKLGSAAEAIGVPAQRAEEFLEIKDGIPEMKRIRNTRFDRVTKLLLYMAEHDEYGNSRSGGP